MVKRGLPLIAGDLLKRYFFDPAAGKALNGDTLIDTYGQVDGALLSDGLAISNGDDDDVSAADVIADAALDDKPYVKVVEDLIIKAVDAGDSGDQ